MQDTKLRNFHTRDTNNLRMHMKNNKRHKTGEFKDQNKEDHQEQLEDQ